MGGVAGFVWTEDPSVSENMRFQKNPRSCGRHIAGRNVAGKPVSCGSLYLPVKRRTAIVAHWLSLPHSLTSC